MRGVWGRRVLVLQGRKVWKRHRNKSKNCKYCMIGIQGNEKGTILCTTQTKNKKQKIDDLIKIYSPLSKQSLFSYPHFLLCFFFLALINHMAPRTWTQPQSIITLALQVHPPHGVASIPSLSVEEAVVPPPHNSEEEYASWNFWCPPFLPLLFSSSCIWIRWAILGTLPFRKTWHGWLEFLYCRELEPTNWAPASQAIPLGGKKPFLSLRLLRPQTDVFSFFNWWSQGEGYTFCTRMSNPAPARMFTSSGRFWWSRTRLRCRGSSEPTLCGEFPGKLTNKSPAHVHIIAYLYMWCHIYIYI